MSEPGNKRLEEILSKYPLDGAMRRVVPKSEAMRLMQQGYFAERLADGTTFTDWKKVDAAICISRPTKILDLKDGELPTKRKGFITFITVEQKQYTVRQVEHFGDAICYLAARMLAHEVHGTTRNKYGRLQSRLTTNQNFSTCPGVKNGDHFEVIVGTEILRSGVEAGFKKAIEMLKQTSAYQCAVRTPEKELRGG